jgi:Primase X
MTTMQTAIEEGLDFVLSHLQVKSQVLSQTLEPFPRTISTKATNPRQVVVNSREEALARFAQADFVDCRISAYPPNTLENPSATRRFMGIRTATPAYLIIMMDLDRCNFKTDRGFNMVYARVLGNIKQRLGATPTILWSGRGYHIILPLNSNGIILENVKEFEGIFNISLKFLRYAESSLSLKKSDQQHNNTVSFNNCMLRIPGSINSKNGQTVKVIQKWDGIRPEINYLLAGFKRYIINEKYLELLNANKRKRRGYLKVNDISDSSNEIDWIERLLQTPLPDFRKYCIWRILSPYLLNIKKLSEQESYDIIANWLDQCSNLRRLDFNRRQKILEGLEGATEGYLSIGHDKLKEENGDLYYLLQSSLIK